MNRQPHYPDDAAVGDAAASTDGEAAAAAAGEGTPPGDAKAGDAKAGDAKAGDAKAGDAGKNKHLMTGAAIGIGSAAIVAALLYAKGRNRGDKA
ncbi:MAG TPA: hypothetical protein VEZ70_07035 [Allosphingosinicella sp.]|nr:hypothetical protein [Allosphingosinicella sp.]